MTGAAIVAVPTCRLGAYSSLAPFLTSHIPLAIVNSLILLHMSGPAGHSTLVSTVALAPPSQPVPGLLAAAPALQFAFPEDLPCLRMLSFAGTHLVPARSASSSAC